MGRGRKKPGQGYIRSGWMEHHKQVTMRELLEKEGRNKTERENGTLEKDSDEGKSTECSAQSTINQYTTTRRT